MYSDGVCVIRNWLIVCFSLQFSIEWVLDNPIPYHTFDEPPLIVETDHPIGFDITTAHHAPPSADFDVVKH